MKIQIKYVAFILQIVITNLSLYGQDKNHSISVYFGYGYGLPDKRYDFLYDKFPLGPVQTVINKSVRATLDDEYAIGMNYKYAITNNVNLGLGIGYAKLVQDFLLPADGNGYFMQSIEPFFWRDTSQYHMIQMQPSIDLKILSKSTILGLNCTGISNISFRKHINLFNLSRNKTEYFSSELYTGVFIGYKRLRFDAGYRLLHWKYRDDAIANNGLRVDTYNLPKWRFQLSYDFWRSKRKGMTTNK